MLGTDAWCRSGNDGTRHNSVLAALGAALLDRLLLNDTCAHLRGVLGPVRVQFLLRTCDVLLLIPPLAALIWLINVGVFQKSQFSSNRVDDCQLVALLREQLQDGLSRHQHAAVSTVASLLFERARSDRCC